jgi:hypothetical protein
MKKLLLFIGIFSLLFSCVKEEPLTVPKVPLYFSLETYGAVLFPENNDIDTISIFIKYEALGVSTVDSVKSIVPFGFVGSIYSKCILLPVGTPLIISVSRKKEKCSYSYLKIYTDPSKPYKYTKFDLYDNRQSMVKVTGLAKPIEFFYLYK